MHEFVSGFSSSQVFSPHADASIAHRSGSGGSRLPSILLSLRACGENNTIPTLDWMRHAISHGINGFQFDSTQTRSIETLGSVHSHVLREIRESVTITCRIGRCSVEDPPVGFGSRQHLLSCLDQFLQQTNLHYVDVLYAHRHDPLTPLAETADALAAAVTQGKALRIGISQYAPAPARCLLSMLEKRHIPIAACQVPYALDNRWPEDGLFFVLKQYGVDCVATDVLGPGSLLNCPGTSGVLLDGLAAARGQTVWQLIHSWALNNSHVTSVLSAPATLPQLDALGTVAQKSYFSGEEKKLIDSFFPSPSSFG
ncbi:aldo/keto reductase [Streptomyces murinus]|uniref:aldo/keto reductase n=1 Tax=Streptomyces murinus TaxID=33900 RepID=UPI0038286DF9